MQGFDALPLIWYFWTIKDIQLSNILPKRILFIDHTLFSTYLLSKIQLIV